MMKLHFMSVIPKFKKNWLRPQILQSLVKHYTIFFYIFFVLTFKCKIYHDLQCDWWQSQWLSGGISAKCILSWLQVALCLKSTLYGQMTRYSQLHKWKVLDRSEFMNFNLCQYFKIGYCLWKLTDFFCVIFVFYPFTYPFTVT